MKFQAPSQDMRNYMRRVERPYYPSGPFIEYVFSVLVAVDQLANALTGGNPDMTISARIGQFSHNSIYWRKLEKLVDWAFLPVEGPNHCWRAMVSEVGRTDRQGSKMAQRVLCFGLWLVVPPFGYLVRVAAALREVRRGDKH